MIDSTTGVDRLRVSIYQSRVTWWASLEVAGLRAEAKLYERFSGEELRLGSFLGELDEHWRGWDGEKCWESLGMNLAARHDGRGHVSLDVTLWRDYLSADRWRARATLVVEAGSFGRLAREARVLDGAG